MKLNKTIYMKKIIIKNIKKIKKENDLYYNY